MPTLLLADDSVTTQRVIALTFADQAVQVVTVGDGQQAIDQMTGTRPDIVLASTSLPRSNGYDLGQYMLGVEALKDVPVLLLSGAFESVDGTRLKASGARGVIEKPLEPTAVINRVRELLGFKEAAPAPPAGRLITSVDITADTKAPPAAGSQPAERKAPPPVLEAKDPEPVPAAPPSPTGGHAEGRDDDRDALDTAFDSLDQHLAGRRVEKPAGPRSASLLEPAIGASDLDSPGRSQGAARDGGQPNGVFEVDRDWFADDPKPRERASSHEIPAETGEALPPRRSAAGDPVFEVDDQWFAEEDSARQSRIAQQRDLAAEMGVHDIELPHAEPVPNAPAPAEGLDFDFGLDDLVTPPAPAARAQELQAPPDAEPVHKAPERPAPQAPTLTPLAPSASGSMADDFAALLAFETGDAPPPAAAIAMPSAMPATAPELTDAMLDQIAQRVADRLSSGTFGADLREAMTATLRETVRSVVSETAERLVRDEIARVKARAERDTH